MRAAPPIAVRLTAQFRVAIQRTRKTCPMQIIMRTETPDGHPVVLPALVYAKVLEQHAAVAELSLIERTVRMPDLRRPDPRPGRERFFRREAGMWALAVVEFSQAPAIIVTVFAADHDPM